MARRIRPEHAVNNAITPSDPNNIPQLPEELLQLIFFHLDTSSYFDLRNNEEAIYRNTLLSLCLANKLFLRLARKVLYRTIHTGIGRGFIVQLSKLFVQEHPTLRELVKGIRVDNWSLVDLDPIMQQDCREPLSADFRRSYVEAVEPAMVDATAKTRSEFLEDLMAGKQDAHLALLILRCEKVEVLSLVLPHGFGKELSWTSRILMRAAASAEGHFSALRELRVQHWDTENCASIHDFWDMLCLPSPRSLHGHEIDLEPDLATMDPHRLYLREVHLDMSIVDAPGLTHLLSCSPDLEVLSIHWGSVLQGDCTIWWDQFGTVLRNCPSAAKLKSVTFDIIEMDYYNTGEGCDSSIHPSLGNLTSLSSLQNLDVPAVALWGSDGDGLVNATLHSIVHTLPPTLKRLGVSCWNDCSSINHQVFDERAESEMGMVETLTADDRLLKDLEVLKVAGEGPMYEGSNLLRKWDVAMKRKAHGNLETKRRMPIEEI